MIFRFLGSFALGLASHIFYQPTLRLGHRWGMFMRYAIGSTALIPAKAIIIGGFPKQDRIKLLLPAELLALLTYGAGVLIGHLLDKE